MQKRLFILSILSMLAMIWIAGYNVGIGTDEMDMKKYGEANINYYATRGLDTSFLFIQYPYGDTVEGRKALRYYGSNFEYLATGINKLAGTANTPQEYNVRHMLNQLLAIIAILFAGLIAAKVSNYRAAIFTSWLIFLTPPFLGWALFDTKDIPFCTGYIVSLYFIIRLLDQLPKPSFKILLCLTLAMAFTMGIRIGGILLCFYTLLFVLFFYMSNPLLRQQIWSRKFLWLILRLLLVFCGALVIVIITWPFALLDPLHHVQDALMAAKKFPFEIPMNYEGHVIVSTHLPKNFLLHYFSINIPLFILAASIAAVFILIITYQKTPWRIIKTVAFAGIFPIIYCILSGMYIYNGWRHLIFMYPACMVLTGLGMEQLMVWLKKWQKQQVFVLLTILSMIHPISWCIRNNPYEFMYYNERVPASTAYFDYETDPWGISVKPAIDWLYKNKQLMTSKDSVIIGTNMNIFAAYYIQAKYPGAKVRVIRANPGHMDPAQWDYYILGTLFLSTDYLHNNYPKSNILHSIKVNGYPITTVIEGKRGK